MRETFMQYIKAMQEEASGKGELQINVTSTLDSHPIAEARISISYTGVPEQTLEQVTTDSSGQSEVLTLDAPPEEWSLDPNNAGEHCRHRDTCKCKSHPEYQDAAE